MDLVNNKTEKEFRDQQHFFGHDNNLDLKSWLSSTYKDSSIKGRRYRKVANDFLGNDASSLDVLEIASGAGDFIMLCSKLFPQHRYVANDISKLLLKNNIKIAADFFGAQTLPVLSFCPVEKLTQPNNSFDIVFVKSAVHHFGNPTRGLEEIHRVLKRGGLLVFIEDPICLNIPLYGNWMKKNFSLTARAIGINEHIYTVADYLSFGKIFLKRKMYIDKELLEEYDKQQKKRVGIKKIIGYVLKINKSLFMKFMIWRFKSTLIFVFRK